MLPQSRGRVNDADRTRQASTKSAILEEGIVWVEEDYAGLLSLRYQPFSSPSLTGLQIEPAVAVMPDSTGIQTGRLREGEVAWYALDISPAPPGYPWIFHGRMQTNRSHAR